MKYFTQAIKNQCFDPREVNALENPQGILADYIHYIGYDVAGAKQWGYPIIRKLEEMIREIKHLVKCYQDGIQLVLPNGKDNFDCFPPLTYCEIIHIVRPIVNNYLATLKEKNPSLGISLLPEDRIYQE